MLQAIREKAQGWIAWLIVIFISIPFALWGIQSYLGGGGESTAATVNGIEISDTDVESRARNYRDDLRARLGRAYKAEMFDEAELRSAARNKLIDEFLLIQAAQDWDIRIGDSALKSYIRSIPAMQRDGRFDPKIYDIVVKNQGMSHKAFEHRLRQDIVLSQIRTAVVDSAFTTKKELAEISRLANQTREVATLTLPADLFAAEATLTDAELREYYQQNSAAYKQPERVKVEYLLLDLDALGTIVDASEEAVQSYYEEHRSEYQAPEERRIRHILIAVPEGAEEGKEQAARTTAGEVISRLNAGEKFADLAREFSDDPGSASLGGGLGWVERGIMDKPFEDKAFELPVGTISEPVRTSFGYHIIEVTDIKTSAEGTLDSVREQVEKAYKTTEAEKIFYDHAEQLADLAYETPDSLMPAAEALGLSIKQSDWFDRSGSSVDFLTPKAVAAAFSDDVMGEGNNSELIELAAQKVLVLRVIEHEAEQLKDFETVKQEVTESLRRQKGSELAKQKGQLILADLNADASLKDQQASDDWVYQAPALVTRTSSALPASVRSRAFTLARPEAGKSSFSGVSLANGDYVLIAVSDVQDGTYTQLDKDAEDGLANNMSAQAGNHALDQLIASLREHADISIRTPQTSNP